MNISRRSFIGASLTAACGCAMGKKTLPRHISDYNGVQVGVISYSYRSMPRDWRTVLDYVRRGSLGTLELMGNDAETVIGIPPPPQDKAQRKAYDQMATERRRTADFGRFRELARVYRDAGVDIHIVKFGSIGSGEKWLDDYYFNVAKALGARAITREVPKPEDCAAVGARLAEPTNRSGIAVAFHNHTQINETTYDGPLLGFSRNLMINFDIGHYTAASVGDPLTFVRKYHDRIFSIHVKDRTTKEHGAKNLAFGQGDTPLKPLFDLMQREGWDYPCDIELEYAIPANSDACREVGICNRHCKNLII